MARVSPRAAECDLPHARRQIEKCKAISGVIGSMPGGLVPKNDPHPQEKSGARESAAFPRTTTTHAWSHDADE
jgi:hypothetical protein